MVINRIIFSAVFLSTLIYAQQLPDQPADTDEQATSQAPAQASPESNAKSGPHSAGWPALTVKEKLKYDWTHILEPEHLVLAGFGAGFDQLRDHPGQWGEGWGPFAERYASHVGQYVIQHAIMFPVQAIDHEDTRYFPSTRPSVKGRVGDALLHTVWRHSDSGEMMPAYSEFLGDYGGAAVSRLWWPKQYHNASSILVAGSDSVLINAGINVFREFKPDIKRWLHLVH